MALVSEPRATITLMFNRSEATSLHKGSKTLVEIWANDDVVDGLKDSEFDPKKTMVVNIHSSKIRVEHFGILERIFQDMKLTQSP